MSTRSHQPMGGRRRSAVSQVMHRRCACSAAWRRISSATRTTCTISRHRVDADDVRAGEHGRGHGGRRAPVALGRGPVAERLAQERLARRPDEHAAGRAPRPARAAAPAHHSCASGRLANPMPGSTMMRSRCHAGRRRDAPCWPRSSAATSPTTSSYAASAYIVFGRPRVCIRTSAAPRSRDDRRQRGLVPQAADVVDDGGARVERPRARRRPCRCRSRSESRSRAGQRLDDRQDAREFLVGGDRLGAGPRRLAADVDEVGAVGLHPQRRVDGAVPGSVPGDAARRTNRG